jgi:hypothetical protein
MQAYIRCQRDKAYPPLWRQRPLVPINERRRLDVDLRGIIAPQHFPGGFGEVGSGQSFWRVLGQFKNSSHCHKYNQQLGLHQHTMDGTFPRHVYTMIIKLRQEICR